VKPIIGIRREDKNRWERRAPLTPDHVRELIVDHEVDVLVEPSPLRIFPDLDYAAAGAQIAADLSPCGVILGVKEIPPDRILPDTTYVFFAHVTKGQPGNMPMLQRIIDLGCTLVDYELIRDRRGRRLVFFGRHAGYAGMIDGLWSLGQRLAWEGFETPLEEVRLAHQYGSLEEATSHLSRLGERIRHVGLPAGLRPVVIAFTGSGNVSRGAQHICDRLPTQPIDPEDVVSISEDRDLPRNVVFTTHLDREHRLERIEGGGFDAAEYIAHPERYRSALRPLLSHLTVLVNGVYWQPAHPRLVTADMVRWLWSAEPQPKLRVIADITCDVGGSIEVNVAAATPGSPVYVWSPEDGTTRPGVEGRGLVVMAVDNLPCELPAEASEHFGDSLLRFVSPLARCNWDEPLDRLALPAELLDAVIVHHSALTPPFLELERHLGRT
jgi:alanine dehydrogenase